MAPVLFTVPISANDGNFFTYTGNMTGAMSTYNNGISAIIGGGVGQNPANIFDIYNPLGGNVPGFIRFQSGRSYQVIGKTNFYLGVSGTDTVALPDKRYIHSRNPEKGKPLGSEINIIGFDTTMLSSPLSTAFNKSASFIEPNGSIQIYAMDESGGRTSFKFWSSSLQSTVDLYQYSTNPSLCAAAISILRNPNFISRFEPGVTYYINNYNTNTEYVSAVRSKNYLLTEAKDFQFDNIFLTTDDGRYIAV